MASTQPSASRSFSRQALKSKLIWPKNPPKAWPTPVLFRVNNHGRPETSDSLVHFHDEPSMFSQIFNIQMGGPRPRRTSLTLHPQFFVDLIVNFTPSKPAM
jgi:hypothetical protein